MVARRSWAVKVAVLVVAMLVAIGSWEFYRGGAALAQVYVGISNGELPHFKCYNFVPAGPPVKAPVTLTDQFVTDANVVVQTRKYLCAPVQKTHNGQFTDADINGKHLVCYHIRPSLGALKTDVTLTDQFRPAGESGEITTPHLLCAPADKNGIVPHQD